MIKYRIDLNMKFFYKGLFVYKKFCLYLLLLSLIPTYAQPTSSSAYIPVTLPDGEISIATPSNASDQFLDLLKGAGLLDQTPSDDLIVATCQLPTETLTQLNNTLGSIQTQIQNSGGNDTAALETFFKTLPENIRCQLPHTQKKGDDVEEGMDTNRSESTMIMIPFSVENTRNNTETDSESLLSHETDPSNVVCTCILSFSCIALLACWEVSAITAAIFYEEYRTVAVYFACLPVVGLCILVASLPEVNALVQ